MSLNVLKPRFLHLLGRKKKVYGWIYKFTRDKCELCAVTGCKCTDRICAHVELCASKLGLGFPKGKHQLRFIGPQGCVVPPEHRETCAIYLCEYAQNKPGFPSEYYKRLVALSARIEFQLMKLEG